MGPQSPSPWGIGRLWPYLLVAACYFATSPYHRGLNNPNEMVRIYMSRSLAQDHSFNIGPVLRQWGPVDDKAKRDGVMMSSKAPLQSLVGVPAHWVAEPILKTVGVPVKKRTVTYILRLFGSVIPGLLLAWWLIWWARRRGQELGSPPGFATGLGLAGGLGTMIYPYSLTFTGHLLAALCVFGTFIAVAALGRHTPDSKIWRWAAIIAGAFGGATPFAEYPAALIAGPAIVAAFFIAPTAKDRLRLFGWLAVGGLIPFGVGLWSHHVMWGAPWKTGYSFLENASYVTAHESGFFGVTYPKPTAVGGALFSSGTGLFFYSPVLIIGALGLFRYGLPRSEHRLGLARPLAVASFVALLFSLYFIGSHSNWRGGWTLGPRYIIGLAPMLWLWTVEASQSRRILSITAALGAISIVITGFSSALYPHLSDVYTNPVWTFVWPSYQAGEISYGVASALGLSGHVANLVHGIPLLIAAIFVAAAGVAATSKARLMRAVVVLVSFGLALAVIALVPEANDDAARRENRRLWGFWEPATPGDGPKGARWRKRKGRVFSARSQWRKIQVEAEMADGSKRPCVSRGAIKCSYGDKNWLYFGPTPFVIDGENMSLLHLHPISNAVVRAQLPVSQPDVQGVLRYAINDPAVASGNDSSVFLVLRQDGKIIGESEAKNQYGMQALEFSLSSTSSVQLELRTKRDGARVFGFDWLLYRQSKSTDPA